MKKMFNEPPKKYFDSGITKRQLDILIAFLTKKSVLEGKKWSLSELSKICNLHLVNHLLKLKNWLLEKEILEEQGAIIIRRNDKFFEVMSFKINYDNIAILLFSELPTRVLWEFAHEYLTMPG